jgi:hypothetical protein
MGFVVHSKWDDWELSYDHTEPHTDEFARFDLSILPNHNPPLARSVRDFDNWSVETLRFPV